MPFSTWPVQTSPIVEQANLAVDKAAWRLAKWYPALKFGQRRWKGDQWNGPMKKSQDGH
jgi:hypothetical protein